MRDLIAKLEAATEGSWELDAEIHGVIGSPGGDDPRYYAFEHGDYPPDYTTSLDAARTLVPGGYGFSVTMDEDGTATAAVFHGQDAWASAANTPELALSAAALKARQP